mmetsp:Transcript_12710/g.30031  ORF Transcript_12710/g.30031 Transcript_12710/m.30031 type:complete len:205 (+) Transcript_12710:220-834(+)
MVDLGESGSVVVIPLCSRFTASIARVAEVAGECNVPHDLPGANHLCVQDNRSELQHVAYTLTATQNCEPIRVIHVGEDMLVECLVGTGDSPLTCRNTFEGCAVIYVSDADLVIAHWCCNDIHRGPFGSDCELEVEGLNRAGWSSRLHGLDIRINEPAHKCHLFVEQPICTTVSITLPKRYTLGNTFSGGLETKPGNDRTLHFKA